MSLPDGVTTCLLTYGPITDTFGNLADSITVEVVADRTIVHAASGRTMFKHPVSVTAEGGGVAQLPVPHTDQAGFRDQQQNALTGWYYTVTLTARFPGGGIESDRKTFQPLVGQVTRDADLLSSPGMVTPGVTVDGTAVTSVLGLTGEVTEADLAATFARVVDGVLIDADDNPIAVGGSARATYDVRDSGAALDGTTDDSVAVQAAIDAASAAGGGIVYIPAQASTGTTGTKSCKINTTLRLKSGVWLRGAGAASVLTGTASPMIALPTSGPVVDRITISDLFLQSPSGVGVYLDTVGTTGGHQLGWPRITLDNVTVTDAASHGIQLANSAVIEARLINCVSLRAGGTGILIQSTDNFLIGCTAAAGASDGFGIFGANNKVSACKGYGNLGRGFVFAGGGRHVVTGCESQDNTAGGYHAVSDRNTITGCLADSDAEFSFCLESNFNTATGCTSMAGGGGSGQVADVGFLFGNGGLNRVVGGYSSLALPVGGNLSSGNSAFFDGTGMVAIASSDEVTPDPYYGDTAEVTLTEDTTITAPPRGHRGQRLRLVIRQDSVGGHVVSFDPVAYIRDATVLATDAFAITLIEFVHDGTRWLQTSLSSVDGINPADFDVTTVSDLAAWHDASDAASITSSGGVVSAWADKSSNGRHLSQPTSGARPTLAATAVNGLPALHFDGADDMLVSGLSTSVNLRTILLVVGFDNPDRYQALLSSNGSGGMDFRLSPTGALELVRQNEALYTDSGGVTIADSAPHLVGLVMNGASGHALSLDGASAGGSGSHALTFTPSRTLVFGAAVEGTGSPVFFLGGFVAEVIVVDRDLTGTADLDDLTGYLAAKWGTA